MGRFLWEIFCPDETNTAVWKIWIWTGSWDQGDQNDPDADAISIIWTALFSALSGDVLWLLFPYFYIWCLNGNNLWVFSDLTVTHVNVCHVCDRSPFSCTVHVSVSVNRTRRVGCFSFLPFLFFLQRKNSSRTKQYLAISKQDSVCHHLTLIGLILTDMFEPDRFSRTKVTPVEASNGWV